MENNFKNPVLRSKKLNEKHPAGNLLEEINEQDMSSIAGGTTDAYSKSLANRAGLGNNYGQYCTVSAECFGTISCGS
ncbi:plantaricin C family lantibiotic [Bacillus inaquosorum]|uniref:plantaricin C family lantibiotic n=1 Tax=Bacillus inaquosorum TaxID=483913 RepID=UPI000B44A636|nr:plantaricin C family lantibiotic [Bacillus inaquosorum]ARV46865.1 hypothetical protein BCV50_18640 [Bacillus subtilis]MEC2063619.1 plantaricin C family lantibiotic [Bacillus inaquosorum]MEC2086787.1 plantaricin C family lantibiotic [Bacillus inaquosorum]